MRAAYRKRLRFISGACLYLLGFALAEAQPLAMSDTLREDGEDAIPLSDEDETRDNAKIRAIAAKLADDDSNSYKFHPDILNWLGETARLKFEREASQLSADELAEKADAYFTAAPGGQTKVEDRQASYRFEMIAKNLHEKMRAVYPGLILEKPVRVFNNVGGVYGVMEVYHCSTTEYLALFGSPLEQRGYSGHYPFMEVYDIMVDGEMKSHGLTATDSLVKTYDPQDISLLKRGERRYYQMSPGSLMLDYGRGFILPAFWQGVIAPTLFINQDLPSLGSQISECMRSMLGRRRA